MRSNIYFWLKFRFNIKLIHHYEVLLNKLYLSY